MKDIIANSNINSKKEALQSYTVKLIDHYKNPRNLGEMKNPNSLGEVRNKKYGDVAYFYLKIEKNNGNAVIKDATFQTFGCAISIATSSILTEIIKGMPLNEAQRISKKDIADELKIPLNLMRHSIDLAIKGLKNAIRNYYDKKYELI